jgi:hypothetical protein
VLQSAALFIATEVETKPQPGRSVEVTNQFGTEVLDLRDSRLLLVPSATGRRWSLDRLDHFLCYDAAPELEREPPEVTLSDRYGTDTLQVGGAFLLCNPVEKTHNGALTPIGSPEEHLTCYELLGVPPGERTRIPRQAGLRTQFGAVRLELLDARALCVPSQKRLLP